MYLELQCINITRHISISCLSQFQTYLKLGARVLFFCFVGRTIWCQTSGVISIFPAHEPFCKFNVFLPLFVLNLSLDPHYFFINVVQINRKRSSFAHYLEKMQPAHDFTPSYFCCCRCTLIFPPKVNVGIIQFFCCAKREFTNLVANKVALWL